jgi:ParB family chromosome partitioning protein
MSEKRALGRGLEALIQPKEIDSASQQERILQIPISEIRTNKYQPRLEFNPEKLNDLVNSIKEKGVVQPVLVRKTSAGYELIAGERRLRAVKSLGIDKIPAIVKNVADIDMLEISLIENIQREELNPMEEAHALRISILRRTRSPTSWAKTARRSRIL